MFSAPRVATNRPAISSKLPRQINSAVGFVGQSRSYAAVNRLAKPGEENPRPILTEDHPMLEPLGTGSKPFPKLACSRIIQGDAGIEPSVIEASDHFAVW